MIKIQVTRSRLELTLIPYSPYSKAKCSECSATSSTCSPSSSSPPHPVFLPHRQHILLRGWRLPQLGLLALALQVCLQYSLWEVFFCCFSLWHLFEFFCCWQFQRCFCWQFLVICWSTCFYSLIKCLEFFVVLIRPSTKVVDTLFPAISITHQGCVST